MISYPVGCFIVAAVVTTVVFLGGMRGVVWVNIFQTVLFMLFGTVAAIVISRNIPGGFEATLSKLGASARGGALLARDRLPQEVFLSYTLIPLSSIMFPHMSIMCLSARKMSAFKNTVIAYPLAIMATWLPCVFLGVVGAALINGLSPSESDGILLRLLSDYSTPVLAGILGAGIMSAVMGSDCHQILALSTMFTKDIFQYYGGQEKYGERGGVFFARVFVLIATVIAYIIALNASEGIFELAVRFAFTGFAAMAPIMVAALFWKRSTKWGALASTIWVAFCLAATWWLQTISDPIAPKPPAAPPAGANRVAAGRPAGNPAPGGPQAGQEGRAGNPSGGPALAGGLGQPTRAGGPGPRKTAPASVPIFPPSKVFERSAVNVTIFGYLPVVPMVLGSAFWMILVSLLTRPPSKETIEKYFPSSEEGAEEPALAAS
jgi:Na+/proline symporter